MPAVPMGLEIKGVCNTQRRVLHDVEEVARSTPVNVSNRPSITERYEGVSEEDEIVPIAEVTAVLRVSTPPFRHSFTHYPFTDMGTSPSLA